MPPRAPAPAPRSGGGASAPAAGEASAGAAGRRGGSALRRLAATLAIVAAGLLAHGNGLRGPFVFDDVPSIVESPNVRALSGPEGPDLARAAWAPPGSGASGRPLVALTLAVDYALADLDAAGAPEPFVFRATNLLVHVLGALVLAALVRAVLARAGRAHAAGIGTAAGLLFVAHPLATSALQHVVYRNEALMALFFLLTVSASLRALEQTTGASLRPLQQTTSASLRALQKTTRRPQAWSALAVLCALCGVLSKEPMAAAPLAVLLVDRTLGSPSLRASLAKRPLLWAGLFATWIPLAALVAAGDRGESVGFAHAEELSAQDYLRTQAGAILHYLRLVVWPHPLVLDHQGWPVARELGAWLPQGLLVLTLLAASAWGVARRALWALPLLVSFLVLAPSSSVIPLGGMLVGEHRAYLPLALLLALTAGAGARLLERLPLAPRARRGTAIALVATLTLGLALATRARNADYRSAVSIYADTVAKVPENWRAHTSLGAALKAEGRLAEAREHYERALELFPRYGLALNNLGNLELALGRPTEAVALLERALATDPDRGDYHFNLAAALLQAQRPADAVRHYERAAELAPARAEFRFGLGLAHELAGREKDAARAYREALRLKPGWPPPAARLRALGQETSEKGGR